jgi:hypothetical protein
MPSSSSTAATWASSKARVAPGVGRPPSGLPFWAVLSVLINLEPPILPAVGWD